MRVKMNKTAGMFKVNKFLLRVAASRSVYGGGWMSKSGLIHHPLPPPTN